MKGISRIFRLGVEAAAVVALKGPQRELSVSDQGVDVVAFQAAPAAESRQLDQDGNARHAALGTDLDGGFGKEQTPNDLDTIADLQGFGPLLKNAGYSDNDTNNILHGNALRFFRRVWNR